MDVRNFHCFILISCIFLKSCTSVRLNDNVECNLDYSTNTISGESKDAKEFKVEVLFIPRLIEDLLNNVPKHKIEYVEWYRQTAREDRYTGYQIIGCADTTWAKTTMAHHIIDKYNVQRMDSIYYDTVYTVSVVDESKIEQSANPCQAILSVNYIDSLTYMKSPRCVSWGMICYQIMPIGMSHKTNKFIGEDRDGLFNIDVNTLIYRNKGLEEYQEYLRSSHGIDMSFTRIDTIDLGVYSRRTQ